MRVKFSIAFLISLSLVVLGCGGGAEIKPADPQISPGVKSHNEAVSALVFSPDGKMLASGSWDNTIKLWKISGGAGQLESTLSGHTNWVQALAFHPTDSKILASGGADNVVKIWSWKEEKVLKTLNHENKVTGLSFSSNGQYLASSSQDGMVRIWEMPDGKIMKVQKNPSPVYCVAFHPNGNIVAYGDSAGKIGLWDFNQENALTTVEAHREAVRSLAFRPENGKYLLSGSDDQTAKMWEITERDASEMRTLSGHTAAVLGVAFSPDNKLASGSKDMAARVWNQSDGEPIFLFNSKSHWIYSVAFNSDGTILATGSKQMVILWSIPDGKFMSVLIDTKVGR